MEHADFVKHITQLVLAASDDQRRRFALETISLLHDSAALALREELSETERQLHERLAVDLERGPLDQLCSDSQCLAESMVLDPVRAIEFHPHLTEYLAAVESWLLFRQTDDPIHIAAIACNRVNTIDHDIGGDVGGYSIHNVLGAAEMVAEYERQQRLLAEVGGSQR